MISSLKINNVALIEENLIKFNNGFNVLTGETGAGKSIIIDSLNFVLGGKADKTLIKSGKDSARVEVVFELNSLSNPILEFFNSINVEPETTIIISRFYSTNGKNEVRVNGEAVTLGMLKKLTINLIDIHGQHDHQSLLDAKNHIKIIDSLSNNISSLKNLLSNKLTELKSINNQISDLGGEGEDKKNNILLLQHVINEIELANLKENEEDELIEKRKLFQNSEKLSKNLQEAYSNLSGEYGGVLGLIKNAVYSLNAVSGITDEIDELKNRLNSSLYEITDIAENISDFISKIDYDENEVNILEERLDLIKDLKRKYGNTVEDIFSYLSKSKEKLNNLINSDEALLKLNKEKSSLLKDIYELCVKLTNERKLVSNSIKEKLLKELSFLGIKNGKFEVVFNNDYSIDNIEKKVTLNGADNLEFMFSANAGIEARPLTKIISGGELSRFMLAFKCVIKDENDIKTLIFDEIDAGIGGLIGVEVGKKICDISKNNQVICITHLAQIAAFGDTNFKIEKKVDNNYTTSSIKLLNEQEKIKEISRMLGLNEGAKTGEASAMELIDFANQYKSNNK